MYYSNYTGQYKLNEKKESGGLLKKLPIQLGVVLVLMVAMISLRYLGGSGEGSIDSKLRGIFYMDKTKEAEDVVAAFSDKVENIMNEDEQKDKEDQDNESDSQNGGNATPTVALSCNPIAGTLNITSPFGERANPITSEQEVHTGIDLEAAINTPVVAVLDGKVEQWENDENYGLIMVVDHGNGIKTKYAHLSKVELSDPGQKVEKGQVIAYTGESGKVTGPHLHFEILFDGKAIDPQQYLLTASNV